MPNRNALRNVLLLQRIILVLVSKVRYACFGIRIKRLRHENVGHCFGFALQQLARHFYNPFLVEALGLFKFAAQVGFFYPQIPLILRLVHHEVQRHVIHLVQIQVHLFLCYDLICILCTNMQM